MMVVQFVPLPLYLDQTRVAFVWIPLAGVSKYLEDFAVWMGTPRLNCLDVTFIIMLKPNSTFHDLPGSSIAHRA
jgi:hypothetical protein